MPNNTILISALAAALTLSSTWVMADDKDQLRDRTQDRMQQQDKDRSTEQDKANVRDRDRTQERIYGSNLMTAQERKEYRAKLRAAKTAEERNQIRKKHHERMKVRAKERGVMLPDDPPAKGMMADPMGPGGGMGPSGGMGSGGGGMGPGGGGRR